MPLGCWYCDFEPNPGFIEMPNNGPIVNCPICNEKSEREIEWEMALLQRTAQEMKRMIG